MTTTSSSASPPPPWPTCLSPTLISLLASFGFTSPTPVQAATIPLMLQRKDVVVEAVTGSGKTLAFLVPVMEMLVKDKATTNKTVRAIVLCPNRELAKQTTKVAKKFCDELDVSLACLTGGESQSSSSFTSSLIVATPGRLAAALSHNADQIPIRDLEILIMDEADALLGPEYAEEVTAILSKLPKQRRTSLFSATQTKELKDMVRAGLRNPAVVCVKVGSSDMSSSSRATPLALRNYYLIVDPQSKLDTLVQLIISNPQLKFICFFATCACVDFFNLVISRACKTTARIFAMHGKMVQRKRNSVFTSFADADHGVLLCTDVAARGIDLPNVDCIIQFDAPKDPDFFVHRVGRTARAGKPGDALVFLLPNEGEAYLNYLKDSLRVPMEKFDVNHKMSNTTSRQNVLSIARELVFEDRAVLEKGTRAFVSYVAHYSEHRLSYLFRVADLDWAGLAKSFALLRIPKMKEFRNEAVLKKLKTEFQEEDQSVVNNIKFKDVDREAKRQKLVESGPMFNKEKKHAMLGKNKQLREERKRGVVVEDTKPKKKKKRSKQQVRDEEWDEFAQDTRMFKKLRQGKISKQEVEDSLFR